MRGNGTAEEREDSRGIRNRGRREGVMRRAGRRGGDVCAEGVWKGQSIESTTATGGGGRLPTG